MFYTPAAVRPRGLGAGLALACAPALVALCAATASAEDGPAAAPPQGSCAPDAPCIVVEYEEPGAGVAKQLVDALRLRLSSEKVRVVAGAAEEGGAGQAAPTVVGRPSLFWIAHLRRLSNDLFLVAVDNQVSTGAEDVVREVARGETEASTVWTMALMIEEIVSPYFAKAEDTPALGAGLAIIEPPAVGGVSAHGEAPRRAFPRLRLVGVGGLVEGVVSTGELAGGPIASVEGALAPRFLASFSAGWAGIAGFSKGGVKGRAQYVPLEIGLGYEMHASRAVELSGWTGLAIGFAIYRTEPAVGDGPSRTDVLFEPGAIASLRLAFAIYGPLSCYLRGGATVAFVRDRLVNQGSVVYEAGWAVPSFDVGFHFRI